MTRRSAGWCAVAGVSALGLVLAVPSCSSTPQLAGLAQGCSINSDCNSPLICAFTRCHEQCATSRDCSGGQTCVASGADKVCELPVESTCTMTSPCATGLVCSSDMTCLNGCQMSTDCKVAGQQCMAGACHDMPADAGVDAPVDAYVAPVDAGIDAPHDAGIDSPPDVGIDSPAIDTGIDACVAPADAGTLGYAPSNFRPDMLAIADGGAPDSGDAAPELTGSAIDWANAPDVNVTAACGYGCLPQPVTVTLSDGSQAWLFAMHSLTIQSSVALSLTASNHLTVEQPAVIFAVLTTVDVQGTIDVGSVAFNPGPGAFGSPGNYTPQGPGGGGNGFTASYPNSAGSGGSFCGVGGRGGFTAAPQSPAGAVYGNANLVPLVAGSGGGSAAGGYFGAGGGAIQISAGTSIYVRSVGVITAGGGGGGKGGGSETAGGSGGAILLEAPSVRIDGVLAANGGGGAGFATGDSPGSDGTPNNIPAPGGTGTAGGAGSAGTTIAGAAGAISTGDAATTVGAGGGGAGWIRINSSCGSATLGASVIISPDLTTSCASQGVVGN